MTDTDCALDEFSPYNFTYAYGHGRWTWRDVLDIIERGRREQRLMDELPREIQGARAALGLSIGLAIRQLAISAEVRQREETNALYGA